MFLCPTVFLAMRAQRLRERLEECTCPESQVATVMRGIRAIETGDLNPKYLQHLQKPDKLDLLPSNKVLDGLLDRFLTLKLQRTTETIELLASELLPKLLWVLVLSSEVPLGNSKGLNHKTRRQADLLEPDLPSFLKRYSTLAETVHHMVQVDGLPVLLNHILHQDTAGHIELVFFAYYSSLLDLALFDLPQTLSPEPTIHYNTLGLLFFSFDELEARFCHGCVRRHRAASRSRTANSRSASARPHSRSCSQSHGHQAPTFVTSSEHSHAHPHTHVDVSLTYQLKRSDLTDSIEKLFTSFLGRGKSGIGTFYRTVISSITGRQQEPNRRNPELSSFPFPLPLISVCEGYSVTGNGYEGPMTTCPAMSRLLLEDIGLSDDGWKARRLRYDVSQDYIEFVQAAEPLYTLFGEFLRGMDHKAARHNMGPCALVACFFCYEFGLDRVGIVEDLAHDGTLTETRFFEYCHIPAEVRYRAQAPLEFALLRAMSSTLSLSTFTDTPFHDSAKRGHERTIELMVDFIKTAIYGSIVTQAHVPTLVLLHNSLFALELHYKTGSHQILLLQDWLLDLIIDQLILAIRDLRTYRHVQEDSVDLPAFAKLSAQPMAYAVGLLASTVCSLSHRGGSLHFQELEMLVEDLIAAGLAHSEQGAMTLPDTTDAIIRRICDSFVIYTCLHLNRGSWSQGVLLKERARDALYSLFAALRHRLDEQGISDHAEYLTGLKRSHMIPKALLARFRTYSEEVIVPPPECY
ncbi:hypothetical protein GMRT_13776 [Giardia muris]|uniref:Uncharacterized protein n=1 Tax=Giardia muris TaxID=5742 RepID=A0A4Z1T447_GIAMU|nr:hypothetical protein GMRT_13776 [Giardia muris]|eukprot:TNJ28753.1 hypothetical protein GMRT_13776 [Giardia muris]